VTQLLEDARAWVEAVDHPHAQHLLRTEHWLLELEPDASEALRLAAVLHDIERAFPDPESGWDSSRDGANPEYNRWHQDRCAEIASAWLREQGADEPLVAEVDKLIRVHEEGGWHEADLLQAADSLSFLETLTWLMKRWPRANAEAKLDASVERIKPSLPHARELAEPLRDAAKSALVAA
jgi:Domain of unknown function (DUF4202)